MIYFAQKSKIKKMKIPGLTFSLKRAVGVSAAKNKIAKKIGLPTTKQGLERKVGDAVISAITCKNKKRK
ncbi:MAG: hypothetical protein E7065_09525 [Lentimicrobiaceae bacterium]|nr:hypothetical protein [Lentimicrobiaceae bacterium]